MVTRSSIVEAMTLRSISVNGILLAILLCKMSKVTGMKWQDLTDSLPTSMDIIYLSDFETPDKINLQEHLLMKHSAESVHIWKEAKQTFPIHVCNSSVPPSMKYDLFHNQPKAYIIWTNSSNIEKAVSLLLQTVVMCPTLTKMGAFYAHNLIMILTNTAEEETLASEVLHQNPLCRNHKFFGIFNDRGEFVSFTRFNPFSNQSHNEIWRSKDITNTMAIFNDLPMSGYTLTVGTMPYAYFTIADIDPNATYVYTT